MSFNLHSFFHVPEFGNWQAAGVEFPPREENSVPLFTPPQSQPIVHHASAYEDAAIQASLQSDASGLRYLLPEKYDLEIFLILKINFNENMCKKMKLLPSFEQNAFFF